MKSVTEFASFIVAAALEIKTALIKEGKTLEEVQVALAEKYKLKEDKLKHFMPALDVAAENLQNLKRIVVVSLAEGENAPNKAVKVEELYFVPEFHVTARPADQKADSKGGRGRGGPRRGGDSGRKSSPWGLSPEEKAAKKGQTPKAVKPS